MSVYAQVVKFNELQKKMSFYNEYSNLLFSKKNLTAHTIFLIKKIKKSIISLIFITRYWEP